MFKAFLLYDMRKANVTIVDVAKKRGQTRQGVSNALNRETIKLNVVLDIAEATGAKLLFRSPFRDFEITKGMIGKVNDGDSLEGTLAEQVLDVLSSAGFTRADLAHAMERPHHSICRTLNTNVVETPMLIASADMVDGELRYVSKDAMFFKLDFESTGYRKNYKKEESK